ncbi:MAG: transglycosylase SLT domain-containing protein [Calditrichaceae bacterium]
MFSGDKEVESSFNYKAYSSAGAAGIWQFTRGTGKQFLKISYEVDERLDPILATEAAAKLLKRNYDALGTWPLAITAYNHGAYGMKRAVRRMKTKKLNAIIKGYRSRYFKFASRNFYCEFVAALHVMQNYETYFGKINFENPIKFKEFPLARYIKYESLSKYLNVNDDLFRKYNPALRLSIYNNSKYVPKGYRVRLPADLSPDSLLAAIPETEYYAKQKRSKYYRIRYGDNLSAIARRFGTNVSTLMSINNISNAHYIRRGMTIRLPDKTDAPVFAAIEKNEQKTVVKTEKFKPENKPEEIKPTGQLASRDADVITITTPIQIEPDDPPLSPALWYPELPDSSIANVDEGIASVMPNTISMADLEIEFLQEQPSVGFISVEPEETLGHYADWLQIRTQTIRNWNKLAYGTPLQLNQKIKLVFTTVDADDFSRKRLEYHRGIEEDFFMNYEITDTTTHVIRNGDNIWYLCNYVYNLPYWLIVDYNKDVDFNNLRAGDELVIPSVKIKSLSYQDEAD